MSTISRRSLIQLAGLTGVGLTLSACAGPGTTTQPGGGAAGAVNLTGPVEGSISFAHWRGEDKAQFDSIIAAFVAANAGVEVRQDISPSNDYNANALQQIRQGTQGDLFAAFRGAQYESMVKASLFADLTKDGPTDKYVANLIGAGTTDGKQYGYPYQLVFNMPLINADLRAQAGYTANPKDWNGFLDLCEKLKSSGVVPIAWPGGEAGNAGQLFNAMVMNEAPSDDMCAQIEAGTMKVTDDWFLTVLRRYEELKPYFQPNATGTAVEPAQQMFASGQSAMLATGSYHMTSVRGLGATFGFDLIAPITTTADKAKYEGIHNATFILGVSTVSKNASTAFALLKHLSDPKAAGDYANGTSQHVTVKDVQYTNPDLLATAPWLERKTLLAPRFQFTNLDIRNAAEGAATAVVGGTSVDEAAASAQRIIDQRVKR
ncbi:MAG: extracellular solute-binding protein [Propioniciclava sp.]|uniref:ABC transporter substrate-binding protein n=1 Tax=Propioniciclava sp. TaxID=2038686 RepID=UPI0039E5F397